jgi:hypothetical protein
LALLDKSVEVITAATSVTFGFTLGPTRALGYELVEVITGSYGRIEAIIACWSLI